MNDNFVIAPGGNTEGFVELARSQKGRLFKKQILKMGESFVHPANPAKKITVDESLALSLQRNFKDKICDIVQVPIANDMNQHVEDPLRNLGEVVDLTYDEKGVYAVLDARKHADDLGSTLLGASAMMHMDYPDTATGERKGPTLLHVAVTNRPYITDLEGFEEVIAASTGGLATSADTEGETPVVLIPADKTEEKMDLNEILLTLKSEHGIDVAALQKQAAEAAQPGELITALSNVVAPEKSGEITLTDIAEAVVELAEEKVALSAQVEDLRAVNEAASQKAAEAEVDGLIKAGKILPKSRESMIRLSRSDRETFDSLVPDSPIVALSATGVDAFEEPGAGDEYNKNIERLASLANGK